MLRDEIRRDGPDFVPPLHASGALRSGHGYYRRARDPFGKQGDFYTAEQIQPVFGILMAARIRALYREMGAPADFTVVELGAGRTARWPTRSPNGDTFRWIWPMGALPERFRGVVFANEFFDALPVERVTFRDGGFRELRVGMGRALRLDAGAAGARGGRRISCAATFRRQRKARVFEVNLDALAWLERIARALEADTSSPSITATRAPSPCGSRAARS